MFGFNSLLYVDKDIKSKMLELKEKSRIIGVERFCDIP
jgi:hypothetical protein